MTDTQNKAEFPYIPQVDGKPYGTTVYATPNEAIQAAEDAGLTPDGALALVFLDTGSRATHGLLGAIGNAVQIPDEEFYPGQHFVVGEDTLPSQLSTLLWGENDDDFTDAASELVDSLTECIQQWADKHGLVSNLYSFVLETDSDEDGNHRIVGPMLYQKGHAE